jgi:hypothetical protein
MGKMPWMKLTTTDWFADPDLQACSLPARGLWVEMMLLMSRSPVRGELRRGDGTPFTAETLARVVREPLEQVQAWMAELEAGAVFKRTADGCIFQSRMIRETKELEQGAERFARHYSRKKSNGGSNGTSNAESNGTSNGVLTPKISEDRRQMTEEDKTPLTPLAEKPKRERGEDVPIPPELQTPDFTAAWGRWLGYRRRKRKPVSVDGARQQLADLAAAGIPEAIATINRSIAGDYQGLFPQTDRGRSAGSRTAAITATRIATEYAESPTPLPMFNLAPEPSNANGGEGGLNGVHAPAR